MLRGVTLPDTRAAEVNLLPTRIDSPRIVYHSLFPFEIWNFLSLSPFISLPQRRKSTRSKGWSMRREIEEEIISKIFENPRERVPSRAQVKGGKKKRRYRGRGDYPYGAKKWLKRRGLRRVCVANRRGPSRATLPPSPTSRADLLATYTPNLTCNGSSKTAESDRQTEGEEERAREWKGSARWSERGKQGVGVGSVRDPTTCGSSR